MVNVALIGASGNVGSRVLKELSDRGHHITAIARHPENIKPYVNVTTRQGDLFAVDKLTALLAGHDVVISSVYFSHSDPRLLVEAVRGAGVPRYIVVGGAGSLLAEQNKPLIEQPYFPEAYKAEASGGVACLQYLKTVSDIDWAFLSPSSEFFAGERTGKFRIGADHLLVDHDGHSRISFEDYAVALVNEIEAPHHHQTRFSVAY